MAVGCSHNLSCKQMAKRGSSGLQHRERLQKPEGRLNHTVAGHKDAPGAHAPSGQCQSRGSVLQGNTNSGHWRITYMGESILCPGQMSDSSGPIWRLLPHPPYPFPSSTAHSPFLGTETSTSFSFPGHFCLLSALLRLDLPFWILHQQHLPPWDPCPVPYFCNFLFSFGCIIVDALCHLLPLWPSV